MGQRRRQCVYCGQVKPRTRDHVFSACLFFEKDANMITVDACEACQRGKQQGEADLRNFITADYLAALHPNAQHLFEKVGTSIRNGSSDLGTNWHLRERRMLRGLGGQSIDAVRVSLTGDAMHRTLEMMIQGLYAYQFKTPLVSTVPVIALFVPHDEIHDFLMDVQQMPLSEWQIKGERVVQWRYWRDPEDFIQTFWVIVFNSGVVVRAATGEPPIEMD